MSDKEFQKLLDRLSKSHRQYIDLLRIAEDEIEKRYGVTPSQIDNDQWIDSYHISCGHMTIEQLHNSMEIHMDIQTHHKRRLYDYHE